MAVQMKFTNNFYNWLATALLSNYWQHGLIQTDGYPSSSQPRWFKEVKTAQENIIAKTDSGYIYSNSLQGLGIFSHDGNYTTTSGSTSGFLIGNGTTPSSPLDTNVENKLDNVTLSVSGMHSPVGDNGVLELTLIVTNNNNAAIDVSEIGLMLGVYGSFWNTASNTTVRSGCYPILMARGVLDTPINIVAGGMGSLVVQLTMPTVAPSA